MSEIPKYSRVDLAEQQRLEAQRQVAAEQRRLAAEAERRQAILRAVHQRRVAAEKAAHARRVEEAKVLHSQRVATVVQSAAAHKAQVEAHFETAARAATAAMRQPTANEAVQHAGATDAPPDWVPPLLTRSASVVERVLEQRAEAGTLLEAARGDTRLATTRGDLARIDASLDLALGGGDDAAVEQAAAEAERVLAAAHAERERLLTLRERRRIIAKAIVQALPERYVVNEERPIEDADGAIRFSASAPGQELQITIAGDTNGDVIGYQADGIDLEERVEDGRVVADCPRFSEQLEELHRELEPLGVHAGELQWRNAPRKRRTQVKRQSGQETKTR